MSGHKLQYPESHQRCTLQILVDVGAGCGYLALAAASRGHRTIAFELDRVALASFNASLVFNGFQRHVTVHQVRPSA